MAKQTQAKPVKRAKRGGRPSLYSLEVATAICDRVALGENVNQICQDDAFPDRSTVYLWLSQHAEFSDLYARARETRADSRADKIDRICQQIERGELEPNAGRVIIDALKWQMAKEQPRRYGERQTLEHTGANGGPIEYASLPEQELDKRLSELTAKLATDSEGKSVH